MGTTAVRRVACTSGGAQPFGRPDRAGDQLHRVGRARTRADRQVPQGAGVVPPAAPAPVGWMGLGGRARRRTRTTRQQSSRPCGARASAAVRSRVGSPISGGCRTATAASSCPPGRGSDAQSTSWTIQAFVAAGAKAAGEALSATSRPQARGRQLPLLADVRQHAGLGDLPGAACAQPQAVPAPLASPAALGAAL